MNDERRYDEEEVREIFDRAARNAVARTEDSRGRGAPGDSGMTLAELKEIGEEVGMTPATIEAAARALDRQGAVAPRETLLGAPVSVGRTVELPRAPTDREWGMLVAELRDTFKARGKVESYGENRGWTNGNLHAYVEPTGTGYRLRMGTLKSDARSMLAGGAMMLTMAIVVSVLLLANGELADKIMAPIILSTIGAGFIGSTFLQLPGWASTRERQMEHIAGRATALLSTPSNDEV